MAVVTRYHHQIHVFRLTVTDEKWGRRKERKRGVEWTGRCHPLPSLNMSTCHFPFPFSSNTICLSISPCLWLSKGRLCSLRGDEETMFGNRAEYKNHFMKHEKLQFLSLLAPPPASNQCDAWLLSQQLTQAEARHEFIEDCVTDCCGSASLMQPTLFDRYCCIKERVKGLKRRSNK